MLAERLKSLLGFAQKAGKIASGEAVAERIIKKEQAKLVLLAVDASEKSKKLFKYLCNQFTTELIECGTKEAFGDAIGRSPRAIIVITDFNFARVIKEELQKQSGKSSF